MGDDSIASILEKKISVDSDPEVKQTSRERPKSALYLRLNLNYAQDVFLNLQKIRNTQRVPLVLGKRFRSSNIAC